MAHIQNPRRSPRAPARCSARLAFSDGSRLDAETEDVSAHGCQVVSARALRVDTVLSVELSCASVDEPLAVQGHVAWASGTAPYRAGIAYEKSGQRAAARWYEALLKSSPGLRPRRGVPDRIEVDRTLYLGSPPRRVLDFGPDEVEILRHVAGGATVGSLRTSFRDRWPTAQYALFSLLERHAVTLDRGAAAHPETWRAILQQAEATLALEALGSSQAAAAALGPKAAPLAPRDPPPGPKGGAKGKAPEAKGGGKGISPAPAATPAPTPYARRTPGAQALLDKALHHLEAGRFPQAKAALEGALALAPGDREIARALADAVSRVRPPAKK